MPYSDPIKLCAKLYPGAVASPSSAGRRHMLQVVEQIAEFRRTALDAAAIVAVTDRNGRITSVNQKFCDLSGYSEDELIGSTHAIVNSGLHDRAFFSELYRTILSDNIWRGVICNRAKCGRLYWVDTTIVPNGDGSGFTAIRFDVTPLKEAEQQLWNQANLDPLTNLPNRRRLIELLAAKVARAEPFAVAILDLDHFKDINDTAGHDIGDRLLTEVAADLRAAIDADEVIGRLGGDEFALILSDHRDERALSRKLARLVQTVRAHPLSETFGWRINASMGAARYPAHGTSESDLLKNADIALYVAKDGGRGRAHVFRKADREAAERRASLHIAVQQALSDDRLFVVYQPILSFDAPGIPAFEALLRWQGTDGVVERPSAFASVFEDERTAAEIGLFVLSRVIEQIERWNAAEHEIDFVSVNATLGDFRDPAFVNAIADAVGTGRIRPQQLCIEITESMVIDRSAKMIRRAATRLRELGVKLAFDDFGTGFASLSHLRDLPLDIVKIDRSFVARMGNLGPDQVIVRSLIDLAHGLGIRVIAEGVERNDQLEALSSYGCDQIQGYLIAKPMRDTEATRFVVPSLNPRALWAA